MARKYENVYHELSTKRIAKCGHKTNEGRYFLCESCKPILEEDSDFLYLGELSDNEEEELC